MAEVDYQNFGQKHDNVVVKLLIIRGDRARTAEGRVGMKLDELKDICEEVGDIEC